MAKPAISHWLTALLLLTASFLFMIATITPPIAKDISFLKVTLKNGTDTKHSAVTFGSFGYCVLNAAGAPAPKKANSKPPAPKPTDYCSKQGIGYKAATIITRSSPPAKFSSNVEKTINNLTGILVLHPVTCVLAFVASLIALFASKTGPVTGVIAVSTAWLMAFVVMLVDFGTWNPIRSAVNGAVSEALKKAKQKPPKGGALPKAEFGNGMWCVVAGWLLLSVCAGGMTWRWRKGKRGGK